MFARRGLEFSAADKRELVGSSAAIASRILERRLEAPGRAEELIEELNALVVAELEHGVETMLGARELLEKLRGRGTPIALVSNSPLSFVLRSLELAGFATHFDAVVSAHEVAAPKPAPDPYLEACRRLGVDPGPDVVALEDSPPGVAAARAAGLTVIGVPSIEGVAAGGSPPPRRPRCSTRSSPSSSSSVSRRGRGAGAGLARRSRAARGRPAAELGSARRRARRRPPPPRPRGARQGRPCRAAWPGSSGPSRSSARSASMPGRSCSAASRSRPASRSARARSSSVSQASSRSRPPSTAASRCWGRSCSSRRRRAEPAAAAGSTSRARAKRLSATSSPLPNPIRAASARSAPSAGRVGSSAATAWACSARLSSAEAAASRASIEPSSAIELSSQAARRRLVGERRVGADRGDPCQRQAGRGGAGLGRPGTAATARGGGRRAQRLDHQHALLGAARQVATVAERQRAGEVELGESE